MAAPASKGLTHLVRGYFMVGGAWRTPLVDKSNFVVGYAIGETKAEAEHRASAAIDNARKVGRLINTLKQLRDAAGPIVAYAATLSDQLPDDAPVTNGLRGPGRITAGEIRALAALVS